MFDLSRPPLLVQPICGKNAALFPEKGDYLLHPISGDRVLVGGKDGWTLPLSTAQQSAVSESPLLVVRDSGGVTMSGGTTTKGYAHIFCKEGGGSVEEESERLGFSGDDTGEWLLVRDSVAMIWFQYGCKDQFLGGTGYAVNRIYYGKLLIRVFEIVSDIAPNFDKHADDISRQAKQLRVGGRTVYLDGWTVDNDRPEAYLRRLLSENGIECYGEAVMKALDRAGKGSI